MSLAQTLNPTDRPGYRLYRAQVRSLTPLTPHFVRVRFESEDFVYFGTGRQDQRIKVIFPLPDRTLADLGPLDPSESDDPGWYGRWRQMADESRPVFRTYTVREIDPEARVLDVDFVDHGATGPAGRWLASAQPGDEVYIAGPDARSVHHLGGIDFRPGGATRLLIAGDETAVPAIAAICERLPAHATAHVYCEVPSAADVLDLAVGPGVRVTWLARTGEKHGALLIPAIRSLVEDNPGFLAESDAPPGDVDETDDDALLWDAAEGASGGFYAWLAGEARAVKTLRRLLVREHNVDRTKVAFMGYWREGRSEN